MYEQYLKYNSIPAGAVLRHILKKEKISQKHLSDKTGIITQRINDLIKNKRRFTVETSAIIARVLPVSNNNVSLTHKPANISLIRKALFWDINAETLDWEKHKKWIIQRVFEYGNDDEVRTIISHYGRQIVIEILSSIKDEWRQTQRENMINKHLQ